MGYEPGNYLQDFFECLWAKAYLRIRQFFACRYWINRNGGGCVMDNNRLLRYSIQLSMLKQLLIRKLIDEKEYKRILHALMRDYGVISDLNT